jgi:hypothetical protein
MDTFILVLMFLPAALFGWAALFFVLASLIFSARGR